MALSSTATNTFVTSSFGSFVSGKRTKNHHTKHNASYRIKVSNEVVTSSTAGVYWVPFTVIVTFASLGGKVTFSVLGLAFWVEAGLGACRGC